MMTTMVRVMAVAVMMMIFKIIMMGTTVMVMIIITGTLEQFND